MKYKTFNYKRYKQCSFFVDNYLYNTECMAIQIIDKYENEIDECTIKLGNFRYSENMTTIDNKEYKFDMTEFLSQLGIIDKVYYKQEVGISKSRTIDFVSINIEKLKEYSSTYLYKWKNKYERIEG